MWIDGIEIVKEDFKCFTINNEYVFISDEKGNVIFSFDMKNNGENVKKDIKEVAEKSILRYDIVKKIQVDYS